MNSPRLPVRTARTFEQLYEDLEDDEKGFFDFLDQQLNTVETFYISRETEAMHRAHDLRDQLHELAEHRKVYHDLYPHGQPEWEANFGRLLPDQVTQNGITGITQKLKLRIPFVHDDSSEGVTENGKARSPSPVGPADEAKRNRLRKEMMADKDHQSYNPERYQKYKKELKAAVLDFYRQLELIKNYRVSLHSVKVIRV